MAENLTVNVLGAGLAGLSAAVTLAENGVKVRLISKKPSERAQSVLAEGGINAALNTMGENDTTEEHFTDTYKSGCYIASEQAVKNLAENAPRIVNKLIDLGAPFNAENGKLTLRNFGGQKKKRTAYAKSSTGKIVTSTMITAVRKYESSGLITRYNRHELNDIVIKDGKCLGLIVKDTFTGEYLKFGGAVILAVGGLNGFFEGETTGTLDNDGNAAATAFINGVEFADMEFIQYHPTTVPISGKRMLVSEAARGEGGRLMVYKNGTPWYFMEEKYPELGNLMPRDVVSREIAGVLSDPACGDQVYLDMTGLNDEIWKKRLPDLRSEIISYLKIDPKTELVPIAPGIHFFMGGIRVDDEHRTNIKDLYAAGECACIYHGANRLGGNSLLGAIFGGEKAANALLKYSEDCEQTEFSEDFIVKDDKEIPHAFGEMLKAILDKGMGIVREEKTLQECLDEIEKILTENLSRREFARITLAKTMVLSAIERKESRGAHYRKDYPETREDYKKVTVAKFDGKNITIEFADADGVKK